MPHINQENTVKKYATCFDKAFANIGSVLLINFLGHYLDNLCSFLGVGKLHHHSFDLIH